MALLCLSRWPSTAPQLAQTSTGLASARTRPAGARKPAAPSQGMRGRQEAAAEVAPLLQPGLRQQSRSVPEELGAAPASISTPRPSHALDSIPPPSWACLPALHPTALCAQPLPGRRLLGLPGHPGRPRRRRGRAGGAGHRQLRAHRRGAAADARRPAARLSARATVLRKLCSAPCSPARQQGAGWSCIYLPGVVPSTQTNRPVH